MQTALTDPIVLFAAFYIASAFRLMMSAISFFHTRSLQKRNSDAHYLSQQYPQIGYAIFAQVFAIAIQIAAAFFAPTVFRLPILGLLSVEFAVACTSYRRAYVQYEVKKFAQERFFFTLQAMEIVISSIFILVLFSLR